MDKNIWILHCRGGEFITIGSFYPDNVVNIDTIINNGSLLAYYYIDDVSVVLCSDTVQNDSIFFVPNAFSPNADGMNDVFKIRGSLSELQCEIFNRWGESVAKLNSPAEVWDGKINGEQASTAVYFYCVLAKDVKGKQITAKGNITLLR